MLDPILVVLDILEAEPDADVLLAHPPPECLYLLVGPARVDVVVRPGLALAGVVVVVELVEWTVPAVGYLRIPAPTDLTLLLQDLEGVLAAMFLCLNDAV